MLLPLTGQDIAVRAIGKVRCSVLAFLDFLKQHAFAGLPIFWTGHVGDQLPADLRVGTPLSHDVEKAVGADADGLVRRKPHGKGVGIEIFGAIGHIPAVDVERKRGVARLFLRLDQRAADLAGTVRQGDKLRRVEAKSLPCRLLPHGPTAPQKARQPEGVAPLVPWVAGKADRVQPYVSHAPLLYQRHPLLGEIQQLLIAPRRVRRVQPCRLPRGGIDQRRVSMGAFEHAVNASIPAAHQTLKRLVQLGNGMPDLRLAAQVLQKAAFQHPGQVVGVAVQQVQVGAVPALQLVQQAVGKAVVFTRRILIVKMQVFMRNFGRMLLEPGRYLPVVVDQKAQGAHRSAGGRGLSHQQGHRQHKRGDSFHCAEFSFPDKMDTKCRTDGAARRIQVTSDAR